MINVFRKEKITPKILTQKILFACRVDTDHKRTIVSTEQFAHITEREEKQFLSHFQKNFSGELDDRMRILHLPKTEAEQELPDQFCRCLQNKCADNNAIDSLFAAIAKTFPAAFSYYILGVYQESDDHTPQIILALCPVIVSKFSSRKNNCSEDFSWLKTIQKPIYFLLYPPVRDGARDIRNVFCCINAKKEIKD